MTKANKLRAALTVAGTDGLYRAACEKILGSAGAFSNFISRKEVLAISDVTGTYFVLNPDYAPRRQRKAAESMPIKRRKKRGKPQKKTMRSVALKIIATPSLRDLAIHNLIETNRQLRQVVAEQVDGIDNNPILAGAIKAAERAEQIAEAA